MTIVLYVLLGVMWVLLIPVVTTIFATIDYKRREGDCGWSRHITTESIYVGGQMTTQKKGHANIQSWLSCQRGWWLVGVFWPVCIPAMLVGYFPVIGINKWFSTMPNRLSRYILEKTQ